MLTVSTPEQFYFDEDVVRTDTQPREEGTETEHLAALGTTATHEQEWEPGRDEEEQMKVWGAKCLPRK